MTGMEAIETGVDTGMSKLAWARGCVGLVDARPRVAIFASRTCPGGLMVRACDYIRSRMGQGVVFCGGFHSPLEQQCLRILLRSDEKIIVCPARSIHSMRLPKEWAEPMEQGRLLVLSPFEEKHSRITATLTRRRNAFVASLADEVFVPHASSGGQIEHLCREIIASGKPVRMLEHPANQYLLALGAKG